ncbi:MAG: hypothetical protein KJZ80_13860 [Hyphomicrobiaceae bacterium]|nr:hypothetical protein [Hyphomicrobiaceae bacterium]
MSGLRRLIAVLRRSAAAAQRYEELSRMGPGGRSKRGVPPDLSRHIFEEFFSGRGD